MSRRRPDDTKRRLLLGSMLVVSVLFLTACSDDADPVVTEAEDPIVSEVTASELSNTVWDVVSFSESDGNVVGIAEEAEWIVTFGEVANTYELNFRINFVCDLAAIDVIVDQGVMTKNGPPTSGGGACIASEPNTTVWILVRIVRSIGEPSVESFLVSRGTDNVLFVQFPDNEVAELRRR